MNQYNGALLTSMEFDPSETTVVDLMDPDRSVRVEKKKSW